LNGPLAILFRYNKWANLQLIDAFRGLSDKQLDGRADGTSGSIRELLVHLVGGQQTFILRTRGRQHEGELGRGSAWPGFDVVRSLALGTSDELIEIAENMTADPDIALPWQGTAYRYPMSFFLLHALEHGVEHRTEINVTLTGLGVEHPDLDPWFYATAAGLGEEVR
jgi:uncharacterized damage-inducible protein DinB